MEELSTTILHSLSHNIEVDGALSNSFCGAVINTLILKPDKNSTKPDKDGTKWKPQTSISHEYRCKIS